MIVLTGIFHGSSFLRSDFRRDGLGGLKDA